MAKRSSVNAFLWTILYCLIKKLQAQARFFKEYLWVISCTCTLVLPAAFRGTFFCESK